MGAFLNVCPIHFQRLFPISPSSGIWIVLSHSRLLMMVSSRRTLSILCRKLLINTCIFVVLQVSAPYSRTILTLVLKILTLVLID
uniref:Ovule protein n=1 Tax=Schistosoma curassoni TaxID=6186 RepID=A0A183KS16_9TREM